MASERVYLANRSPVYPVRAAGGDRAMDGLTLSRPTTNGTACDMGVLSSFHPTRIANAMTVAIGLLDPGGEVLVATDSRASDEKTMTLRDGVLKSVRINDTCALAFAGAEAYADNLVGNLFGFTDEQARGMGSIIEHVEKNGKTLDDGFFTVAANVYRILWQYCINSDRHKEILPNLSVILVGIDEKSGPQYRAWARKWGWSECSGRPKPDKAEYMIFGPSEPKEAGVVLSDLSVPVWERIHGVVQIHRDICPCGVNLDISVRRAGDGFALKPLTGLRQPSSTPAQDSP